MTKILLIERLKELQQDEKRGRGAMATLRRALSEDQADILRAYEYIGYLLPQKDVQIQDDYLLVAALFATHPMYEEPEKNWNNLGTHLAELRRRKQQQNEATDSLDKRFSALVAASREELPYHLRAALRFLKDAALPVHWEMLLWDVQKWEREDADPTKPTVQRRWANAYWQTPKTESDSK
jgi:CRISPR type I-E-associated protein CasB/Cse2